MKRILTLSLLVMLFSGIIISCSKKDDDNPGPINNTPPKSKMELIAKAWIMKEITSNGTLITNQGTTPYLFEKTGVMKDGKDAQGNWLRTNQWAFTGSDSSAIYVYKGQSNQQLWTIKSLSDSRMDIDYTATNGDKFKFVFTP